MSNSRFSAIRTCPVCRQERYVTAGVFDPHWRGAELCPGSGKRAPTVSGFQAVSGNRTFRLGRRTERE